MLLSPDPDGRSILLLVLVVIWAARLGAYLFRRIRKAGKDTRLDEIKPSFLRFLHTWTLQGLWVTVEAAADVQKSRLRAEPRNKGTFIRSGLWSWSRHPNYFGEIVLWIGVAIIAVPVLQGWQWVTLISPVFVFLLLTRVSGVPMLEKKADERWGGQQDYEAYKRRTPVFLPRPPR